MARLGPLLGHIEGLLSLGLVKAAERGAYKCNQCKGKMQDGESRLFLLPLRFDETHVESVEYYRTNGNPIMDVSQIPTGQRACRMTAMYCPSCGYKKVSVVDFLRVRDQEIVKAGDIYEMYEFQGFLY